MEQSLPIYNFNDYRDYLRHWFWASKEINKSMSFRFMSRRLGLTSPNHFHLVIAKKRHFSPETFGKVLRVIKPSSRERQYLKLLFQMNLEANSLAKGELESQLALMRMSNTRIELADEQYRVVSNSLAWYLKMGAEYFEGRTRSEIWNIVHESCQFPVDETHLDYALETLLASGFAERKEDKYFFDFANVSTRWDLDRSEIKSHHANNLRLAQRAITWPIEKRFFSSVTVACDEETYQTMIQEVRSLCLKILDRGNRRTDGQKGPVKVATLQFSLFPFFEFSKPDIGGASNEEN